MMNVRTRDGGHVIKSTAERVAAGAAWLDEHKPGWERIVDLPALELTSGCRCVLGQVFQENAVAAGNLYREWTDVVYSHSGFNWVLDQIVGDGMLGFDDNGWSEWHGFDAYDANGLGDSLPGDYAALQEAWTDLIKLRFDTGLSA